MDKEKAGTLAGVNRSSRRAPAEATGTPVKIEKPLRFLAAFAAAVLLIGCPAPNQPEPPAAPSGLTATGESNSSIQVAWTDNSDNEDNFIVEYAKAADFSGKVEISLPADSIDKLVESLDASTKYYFRVYAKNTDGNSGYSNVADATTQDPPVAAPAAPSGLTATAASSSSIQTGWTDNSNNENVFILQHCKNADFTGVTTSFNIAANTTSKLVESLEANTTYYFRVEAVNDAGYSAWSNIADATTQQNIIRGTMVINNDAIYAKTQNVTINNSVIGAIEMRFKNSTEGWSNWEAYGTSKAWTLQTGDGEKTVNGEFKDAFGTVLAMSDSITLDTVPPSVIAFVISGPYSQNYSNSLNVALVANVTGATQMRFKNSGLGWSNWEGYAVTRAWILPSGADGTRIVDAEFRDAAENVSPTSDDIPLDMTPPVVSSFVICNNAGSQNWAYGKAVTLHNDVTGATQMRFSTMSPPWDPRFAPAWEPYAAAKSFSINTAENKNEYVYAEFGDGHGNVVQTSDYIYYDAVRTIRFTATSITVYNDGDGGGGGEIYWSFYCDSSTNGSYIYNLPESQAHSMDDNSGAGRTWNFDDVSVEVPLFNNSYGQWYHIHFQVFDSDDGPDSQSDLATVTFRRVDYPSNGWDSFYNGYYAIPAIGQVRATMNYYIEVID